LLEGQETGPVAVDDGATLDEVDEVDEAADAEEVAGAEEAAGDGDWVDDEGVTSVAAALGELDDTALDADGEPETALKLAPQTLVL
jgi:hypothetical protein